MTHQFRLSFAAVALCSCTLLCVTPQSMASGPPRGGDVGVQFRFSIADPTTTLHEPVYMLFTVHNGLGRKTTLYLGKNRNESFQFTVADS
jgi:hypothetical protein